MNQQVKVLRPAVIASLIAFLLALSTFQKPFASEYGANFFTLGVMYALLVSCIVFGVVIVWQFLRRKFIRPVDCLTRPKKRFALFAPIVSAQDANKVIAGGISVQLVVFFFNVVILRMAAGASGLDLYDIITIALFGALLAVVYFGKSRVVAAVILFLSITSLCSAMYNRFNGHIAPSNIFGEAIIAWVAYRLTCATFFLQKSNKESGWVTSSKGDAEIEDVPHWNTDSGLQENSKHKHSASTGLASGNFLSVLSTNVLENIDGGDCDNSNLNSTYASQARPIYRILGWLFFVSLITVALFIGGYWTVERQRDNVRLEYHNDGGWKWLDKYKTSQILTLEGAGKSFLRRTYPKLGYIVTANKDNSHYLHSTVHFYVNCKPKTVITTSKKFSDGTPKTLTCNNEGTVLSYSVVWSSGADDQLWEEDLDGFSFRENFMYWDFDLLDQEVTLSTAK